MYNLLTTILLINLLISGFYNDGDYVSNEH